MAKRVKRLSPGVRQALENQRLVVKRARDDQHLAEAAVLDAAKKWYSTDAGTSGQLHRHAEIVLYEAVYEYNRCTMVVEQYAGRGRR